MSGLRGIGWDHLRCLGPMRAAAAAWAGRGGAEIEWDARLLAASGDRLVAELAESYDLLVIDHPSVGTAVEAGCLAPLEGLLGADPLAALAADSAGPSHASYEYGGSQWALAVTAGCQVAVARDDLLAALGVPAPATWRDVLGLARAHPGRVGWPLGPTGAFCSLLTLCANAGRPVAAGETFFADGESGEAALGFLGELAPLLHPRSLETGSPELLDLMSETDEIAYAPLAFGDPGYARPDTPGQPLRFGDVSSAGHGPVGSVLGGAGVAVSAASGEQEEAAAFAAWVCGPEAQAEVVVPAGGQPASRACREDPGLDARVGGFFTGTKATLEDAWTRPRDRWWPAFQAEAGQLVAEFLQGGGWARLAAAELERAHRRHRGAAAP